jgi:hypothetical protein
LLSVQYPQLTLLAVDIKHAELDHLRYVDYKYSLNFRSIVIDPPSKMATVSVVEDNEVIYEISAELNAENPIVSRTANIGHTIVLHAEQQYDDTGAARRRSPANEPAWQLHGAI